MRPVAPGSEARPREAAQRILGTSSRGRASCGGGCGVAGSSTAIAGRGTRHGTAETRCALALRRMNRRTSDQAGALNKRGAPAPDNNMQRNAAPLRGFGGGQESPERTTTTESGWLGSRSRSAGAAPAKRNGALAAGRPKAAAVLRKAAHKKKRTTVGSSAFFFDGRSL